MPSERRPSRWLRRVREVGAAGLARRARALATHAARARAPERWLVRWAEPLSASQLAARALGAPAPAPAGEAREALRALHARLAAGPFWMDARDPALRARLLRRHRAAIDVWLAQAEATLRGDVAWVAPGAVPDWHRALPGDGRWPLAHGEATGIGAASPPGDVRLAWELGRCPHVVRLAQAAWITGEPRFVRGAIDEMRRFVEENPPGRGIAWLHAQEVALRAVAWTWAFSLLAGRPEWDDAAFERWLTIVLSHGELVEVELTDHVITHNHLVSELGGLCTLGLALPALAPAARWRRRGLALFEREIRKQTGDDGVQAEHSTHYHGFVLDSWVSVLLLAGRAGVCVSDDARARVGAMAEALAGWLRPDGSIPAIGDTDAGRAWRLGVDPCDRRDTVAAAAHALRRHDLHALAGDAPGAFWITGGARAPEASPVLAAAPRTPRVHAEFGLAVARGAGDELVFFRAGHTRPRADVNESHAHADALSFCWSLASDDVVVDPGVFLYSEPDGWRVHFRRTATHSCVVVDERDQVDVSTHRFGVLGLRPARFEHVAGGDGWLIAEAEHPAQGTPRVRRRLAWRAGTGLVLDDTVIGEGEHAIACWLQLPASRGEPRGTGIDLALANGLRVRVRGLDGFAGLGVQRGREGDRPGPGWISRRYGTREPGTALCFDAGKRALPARTILVLQATRGTLPAEEPALEANGVERAVRIGAWRIALPQHGVARWEKLG